MSKHQFELVTDWEFDVPLDRIWETLREVEQWPSWWSSVRKVERIHEGDKDGIGAVHRLTWQTVLSYSLTLATEVTFVEPMSRIEARARGDVEGVGIWTLHYERGVTFVRYVWRVKVTRRWMQLLLPLLWRVFAWNHRKVMDIGYIGFRRRLSDQVSAPAIQS